MSGRRHLEGASVSGLMARILIDVALVLAVLVGGTTADAAAEQTSMSMRRCSWRVRRSSIFYRAMRELRTHWGIGHDQREDRSSRIRNLRAG